MRKYTRYSRRKPYRRIQWDPAPEIEERIRKIVANINAPWIDTSSISVRRSFNANTQAYARIWGLGRIWQETLNIKPHYVIEVVSEKFDLLSQHEQDKVLIHELAHIPKSFSGSLLAHTRKKRGNFHDKVDALLNQFVGNTRRK